jgi:hypothetical protein
VVVPAGSHQLRMEFHPIVFPLSMANSLAAAVVLLLLVGQPILAAGHLSGGRLRFL